MIGASSGGSKTGRREEEEKGDAKAAVRIANI
jgi:hypothetical protein